MGNYDFLQAKFRELSAIETQLRNHFEGRPLSSRFSLDGQIIGAFAEQIIAEWYGLTLCNQRGYDATTRDGRHVEIKVRSGTLNAYHLRHSADDTILLYFKRIQGTNEIPFNIELKFNGTVGDYRNRKESCDLLKVIDKNKQ